jgi:hypothetical protein
VQSKGLAVDLYDPNLPIQPDAGFSSYTSAAALNNLGASSAHAGAPDPGTYIGPLVGTLNGVGSEQAPPVPRMPGQVSSNFPAQPSATQRNGGYVIAADSTDRASTAFVNLGPMAPGAKNATLFSIAHIASEAGGALQAVGSAGVDLLNVGDILDIGRVSSSVVLKQASSGAQQIETTTDVGTITVSGQKFGLDEHGLTAAGQSSGSSADEVNKATAALAEAGISIRYLPAVVTYMPGNSTVASVRSGVVEVAYQRDVPSQGRVTTTYTLGDVELSTGDPALADPVLSSDSSAATSKPATDRGSRATATPARGIRASSGERSVAIISPTLKFLRFGSVVGLPFGCNTFAGALGAGATQVGGGGGDTGSALSNGTETCSVVGNSGGEHLTSAMAQTQPLAVLNPAIDPGIDAFATALETIGRDHADVVAPFGPTIADMAADARFFKGCDDC